MPNSPEFTICNTSDNDTFNQIVQNRLSRRGFLNGSLSSIAAASLGGVGALLKAVPASAEGAGRELRCSASRASRCRPPTRWSSRRATRPAC